MYTQSTLLFTQKFPKIKVFISTIARIYAKTPSLEHNTRKTIQIYNDSPNMTKNICNFHYIFTVYYFLI